MSNLQKLANLFAERTNPTYINITTGLVISESPLRVQYGESVILDETHLVISSRIETLSLQSGDKVILVPDNDFNKWYMLDKVGSI
jgi:hypothetical protein